jgi:hypothetical protein
MQQQQELHFNNSISYERILELSSSPVSVSWIIDRTGDRSIWGDHNIFREPELEPELPNDRIINISGYQNINYFGHHNRIDVNNNINIIENNFNIYNNIEIDSSILNTFVSVKVQENMVLTAEQRDCCICMEDIIQSDICRFSCDHTFCGNCCSSSLQSKIRCNQMMRCPLCRAEVTSVNVQNNENREKFIISH